MAEQVLTYNSKNFHWLSKKQDLERTISEFRTISKKHQIKKNNTHSLQIAEK